VPEYDIPAIAGRLCLEHEHEKQNSGRAQMNRLIRFLKAEEGATAGEYALIVSLIAVAIIVGAMAVGTSINSKISIVASSIAASGS
jgi:pilus assembly protein Flp/PilA